MASHSTHIRKTLTNALLHPRIRLPSSPLFSAAHMSVRLHLSVFKPSRLRRIRPAAAHTALQHFLCVCVSASILRSVKSRIVIKMQMEM